MRVETCSPEDTVRRRSCTAAAIDNILSAVQRNIENDDEKGLKMAKSTSEMAGTKMEEFSCIRVQALISSLMEFLLTWFFNK